MSCSRCGNNKLTTLLVLDDSPDNSSICVDCLHDRMNELMKISNPASISYTRLDSGERWALTCSLQGTARVAMLPQRQD